MQHLMNELTTFLASRNCDFCVFVSGFDDEDAVCEDCLSTNEINTHAVQSNLEMFDFQMYDLHTEATVLLE